MFKKKQNKVIQQAARKLIAMANPKSVISEQFRTLRTNINFSAPDGELRSFVYTSASPSEGKSTVAANAAIVFAQAGKKVAFIDGDMRKPTVHYTFHMQNTAGLSNVLTKQALAEDVIKESSIPNLDVMTCGPIPPNPAELLGSNATTKLIEELKEIYDVIIFDAPPVLSVTDAQIVSNKVDGTVLVLSANNTEKDSIVKAKELLDAAQANIIGTVLNNYVIEKDQYYQYYGTTE